MNNAGNQKRILQWFGSTIGGLQHGKGAKALSQFAFINRDICWEELEWKGKHGQSPAIVATKPYYFLDLDIEQTIENFLENVPEFWSSTEFGESLKDGEILFTDTKFFLEYFVDLMYKEDSYDVWELITEFLKEESFSYLCHHLLITLEERDLCKFINQLHKVLSPGIHSKKAKDSSNSFLFEVILSKFNDLGSFDQLLLVHAILNKKRELLKLLREEGSEEAQAEIKNIVTQICKIPENENVWTPIIRDCNRRKMIEAIKLLVLQSWVLYYIMSEECRTQESWESLFMKNAIGFRKSDNYALLNHDELLEEYGSDLDHRVKNQAKRKKKGISRKKRRRHFDGDGIYDDDFIDFSITNNRLGLHSDVGSWFLATDGYSASWSSVSSLLSLYNHLISNHYSLQLLPLLFYYFSSFFCDLYIRMLLVGLFYHSFYLEILIWWYKWLYAAV